MTIRWRCCFAFGLPEDERDNIGQVSWARQRTWRWSSSSWAPRRSSIIFITASVWWRRAQPIRRLCLSSSSPWSSLSWMLDIINTFWPNRSTFGPPVRALYVRVGVTGGPRLSFAAIKYFFPCKFKTIVSLWRPKMIPGQYCRPHWVEFLGATKLGLARTAAHLSGLTCSQNSDD